jgi:hypothetical protein
MIIIEIVFSASHRDRVEVHMSGQRSFGGDEREMVTWVPAAPLYMPGFVIFPIPTATVGTAWENALRTYQLAYERAQAAVRPSVYELAHLISRN